MTRARVVRMLVVLVCIAWAYGMLPTAHGKGVSLGIAGKSGWLFYQYDVLDPSEEGATNKSVALIARLNRVLSENGVALLVAIVPIKMRIYSEYLPDDRKMNGYMAAHYERVLALLRADNVDASDLGGAFLSYVAQVNDDPVFFLRDTHWNPTGTLLAAEVLKSSVKSSARLMAAMESAPQVDYQIGIGNLKRPFKGGDLVGQLPKKLTPVVPEQVKPVSVIRLGAPTGGITSDLSSNGIALVGSTYSYEWTGFKDALRYTMQRDIFSATYTPSEGHWRGIENYIGSAHFQSRRTKLLIWEIPERELRGTPSYRFRDPHSLVDDEEWLFRVSAKVQKNCKPAYITPKIERIGLAERAVSLGDTHITTTATKASEYIQIVFDKPLSPSNYLSALYTANGSKSIVVESSGSDVKSRTSMVSYDNEIEQSLRVAVPASGTLVSQVKIFPGTGRGFRLRDLQVCQQPEHLLK